MTGSRIEPGGRAVTLAPGIVELREEPRRDTAVVRVTIPAAAFPDEVGRSIGETMHAAEAAGVAMTGMPFVRYHSFQPEAIEAEIGIPVARAIAPSGRVLASELPGGTVAVVLHVGPYDALGDTYAGLERWLVDNGRTRAGGPWEIYLTGPETDQAAARTEIIQPLA
jgi:effector-binding domain-containing protein